MAQSGRIRAGIGGWTFEPWRDNFYPQGWPHSRELEYASRQMTAIEVNGTYYSSQKPQTFAKWRDETPEGFVFSVKAHRFTTHRRELGTAGEGIAVDADGNVYAAEGPNSLVQAGGAFTKYSVK